MHVLDSLLQKQFPVVVAPKFSDFEPLATPGDRFVVAEQGLLLETRRAWVHAVSPVQGGPMLRPVPFGAGPAVGVRLLCGALPAEMERRFIDRARRALPNECACWITWNEYTRTFAYRDVQVLEHPGGLEVEVFDDDTVSQANIGRQMFFPSDVGQPKAEVLVHRINMTMGTRWKAHYCRIMASDELQHDVVLGCVDTRLARFNILRAMERGVVGMSYWLDFGNRKDTGQVILGQVSRSGRKTNPRDKLPHVGELMPEVIDTTMEDPDEGPSCSLAEALEKQNLFVNRAVVVHGMNLLWELFRYGKIDHHGAFVNLKSGTTRPLQVDPAQWERFGYGKTKRHFRKRVAH